MIAHHLATQLSTQLTTQVGRTPGVKSELGCSWWNLACQGGQQVANSGLSAITKSIATGANMLLGEIVKIVDESTTVPLADPTYQRVYTGFLGLAAPLIGVILLAALVMAAVRRDPGTLGRAVVGIGAASLGGALYIVFAQLLVGLDDWLAHGIVRVTGYNLTDAMTELATGFDQVAGTTGEVAANMLLLLLMFIMLVAALILWFVLVLRKIAILVVVAFAPLLIAGYLWAPTRGWVRKATEVLVALVFTKSAIFALFGIGLALLSRGASQSLSDFVGATVLMCGACFAPMVMLRLVHFAADTHLAGDMIGTLRAGAQPVTSRIPTPFGHTQGRSEMARSQAQAAPPSTGSHSRTDGSTAGGTVGTAAGAAAGGTTGGILLATQAATARQPRAHRGHEKPDQPPPRGRDGSQTDPADGVIRGPSAPGPDQDGDPQ